MHFPRQHRRKLFFPPGLLALAFLLLMGCMWMSRDARLQPKTILLVNFLPTYPSRELLAYTETTPYLSERQLQQFCDWDEFTLSGQILHDSLLLTRVNHLIADYQKYAMHRRGIRIQFSDAARYASLVEVVNIMQKHNVKKYWFKLHHTPTVFYAYVEQGAFYDTARPLEN